MVLVGDFYSQELNLNFNNSRQPTAMIYLLTMTLMPKNLEFDQQNVIFMNGLKGQMKKIAEGGNVFDKTNLDHNQTTQNLPCLKIASVRWMMQ